MSRRQAVYWLLTIPHANFTPYLPGTVAWIRGQLELGAGGYLHWQVILGFNSKGSLASVQKIFGTGLHAEISRSAAASEYVWKEDTRVEGTQFELGKRPFKRNEPNDWDSIWALAVAGRLEEIPAHVRFQSYRTIRAISCDFAKPVGMERTCWVFWGATGTGKSRRAWEEAGVDAYTKDPNTKFWCGYSGQSHVVIDEFRGRIDVSHLLRWLDRYPVNVEIKGSSVPLCCNTLWVTSNLDPRCWYPEMDEETKLALLRRLNITRFL